LGITVLSHCFLVYVIILVEVKYLIVSRTFTLIVFSLSLLGILRVLGG